MTRASARSTGLLAILSLVTGLSAGAAPLPDALGFASIQSALQDASGGAGTPPTRVRVDPDSTPYGKVVAFMNDLAKRFPASTRLFVVGPSDSSASGKIWGLAIGRGSLRNLVVATHHGNEFGSTEVAKGLAASLAAAPLVGQTVLVIPVLNIGGYDAGQRNELAGARSVDPNRDYPGPCGTEGPFLLKSTLALARLIEQAEIVTSATLHTFTPAVVYPWGMSTKEIATPYDPVFRSIAAAAVVESKYPIGNSSELIYGANGCYEDYAFWKHGIWSILFELGRTHNPNADDIAEMVRVNVPGIRRMLQEAPRQRAEKHAFFGKCEPSRHDRHDE